MSKILTVLLIIGWSAFSPDQSNKNEIPSFEISEKVEGKYKLGDTVYCRQWENGSYWKGTVVKILKDVVYKVKLEKVVVNGAFKIYLNKSDCTGRRKLSYENGKGYYESQIWVHERCLE